MPVDFTGLVGIDLGTTFSCVAHLTKEGYPRTIANREGELITPSVVLIESDMVIVGREAKRSECVYPDCTAVCMKRDMGATDYSKQVAGTTYRPEILSALVLKRLKADAEAKLGEVRHAVITVPAYFDDARRKATQDAGAIAGLNVLDIINEPTAAALAYAFELHQRTGGKPEAFFEVFGKESMTTLVYDLGGGTFDVSIVRMSPEKFEIVATDGDVRLGGRDWDEKLVNFAADAFVKKFGSDPRKDPQSLASLFLAAEQAKHGLSVRQTTRMLIVHDAQKLTLDITREEFEAITNVLLTRTQMTTDLVVEAAGLVWSEVDRVLCVGGMTRMPAVRRMLHDLSGREPDVSMAADEVVAHGAAIHGGIVLAREQGGQEGPHGRFWRNFQTTDVNSHSLGIAVRTKAGYANSILIPKNTSLPVSKTKVFHTGSANQRQVRVRVLEGEALDASACVQIGEFLIRNLPPNLPERSPVEIECRYSSDGRISVVGRDLTSGQLAETTIVRQGGLEDTALAHEAKKYEDLVVS